MLNDYYYFGFWAISTNIFVVSLDGVVGTVWCQEPDLGLPTCKASALPYPWLNSRLFKGLFTSFNSSVRWRPIWGGNICVSVSWNMPTDNYGPMRCWGWMLEFLHAKSVSQILLQADFATWLSIWLSTSLVQEKAYIYIFLQNNNNFLKHY